MKISKLYIITLFITILLFTLNSNTFNIQARAKCELYQNQFYYQIAELDEDIENQFDCQFSDCKKNKNITFKTVVDTLKNNKKYVEKLFDNICKGLEENNLVCLKENKKQFVEYISSKSQLIQNKTQDEKDLIKAKNKLAKILVEATRKYATDTQTLEQIDTNFKNCNG